MAMLFRITTASAATLALLAATLAVSPADAQVRRRGGDGAGVAAGVLGGLAAGALVGGALAGSGYADQGYADQGYAGQGYADQGYAPGGAEGPYAEEGCPPVRQPVYDGAGRFVGYRALPAC